MCDTKGLGDKTSAGPQSGADHMARAESGVDPSRLPSSPRNVGVPVQKSHPSLYSHSHRAAGERGSWPTSLEVAVIQDDRTSAGHIQATFRGERHDMDGPIQDLFWYTHIFRPEQIDRPLWM